MSNNTVGNWGLDYPVGRRVYHNDFLEYHSYATKALLDAAALTWTDASPRIAWVTSEARFYYWNGASVVAFPSTGGSGAPIDASYVTINTEVGLSAEIQHANISNDAQLHICKLHKLTHENEGTDEINVSGLSGVLADEQLAGWIKGKSVDAPVAGDNLKFLQYLHAGNKLQWASIAGGGDMTKAVYDTDSDNVVDNADMLDGSHASAFATTAHKTTHTEGSTDAFALADVLSCVARTKVEVDDTLKGTRRTINFAAGSGISITGTDVGGVTDQVTVTIAASGTAYEYYATATALSAYTPPGTAYDGRIVVVHSTHATDGGDGTFKYSGAAWHFIEVM